MKEKNLILFKSMNFQDIINSEHKMLMEAEDKYNKHFKNCINFVSLTQDFISEVKMESWVFNALLAYIRKYLLLSFFSALRLHHVQSFANLRQVLEGTSMACYALAFPEIKNFITIDQDNVARNSTIIEKNKHYKWLEQNYPDASLVIKKTKEDFINKTCAHCSLVYTIQHFQMNDSSFEFSFFDKDDLDLVKGDLWLIGHTAGNLMDIFYGINKNYKLLTFSDNFIKRLTNLRKENEEIREEMKNKPRFKKWSDKLNKIQ